MLDVINDIVKCFKICHILGIQPISPFVQRNLNDLLIDCVYDKFIRQYSSSPPISHWARKFKEVHAKKNLPNQMNQFLEKFFDQNPFFAISKMAKKQFLN